ncbi:MAG: hypothetical protein ACRYFX_17010 [Janthinobacterium lividum]
MTVINQLFHRIRAAFFSRRSPSLQEEGGEQIGVAQDIQLQLLDSQLDDSAEAYERIKHIERQIANLSIEVGVVFDRKGQILFIKKGTAKEVYFSPDEEKKTENCIVTHNHPGRTYFSEIDIFYAHRSKVLELRVVAGSTLPYNFSCL